MTLAADTLTDVLAPAALTVAILTIILAPLTRHLARTRTRQAELTRQLQHAEQRLAALAALTGRGFATTNSALEYAHGLLERAKQGRLQEIDQQTLIQQFAQLRQGIERAWAEANLLTDDQVLLTSAQEQLNGRLADTHTAEVERARRPPAT